MCRLCSIVKSSHHVFLIYRSGGKSKQGVPYYYFKDFFPPTDLLCMNVIFRCVAFLPLIGMLHSTKCEHDLAEAGV